MNTQKECVFCDIIAGDRSSYVVYDKIDVVAFLDINPLAPGHTLVVPRDHFRTLPEMPPDVGGQIGRAIVELTTNIQQAVDADGSTVGFNNGSAAGQVVPHVHAHIIPRFRDDGGRNLHSVVNRSLSRKQDLATIAKRIRSSTPESSVT